MDAIDPLPGLVGFTRSLTVAGLAVTTGSAAAYLDAVGRLDVADPGQLYWAGRLTLCTQPDDLPRYNEAFANWFGEVPVPRQTATEKVRLRATIAPLGGEGDADTHVGDDQDDQLRVAASDTEVLRTRDIAELTPAERAHLDEMLTKLRPVPPTRPALRRRRARHGRLEPRRTLRGMLATGGEPVRLRYGRKAFRPRRVVLLVDVSGSMSPYADALLRFAHVVTRRNPASTEVYSLGTRMTRLSRALRARDPELALAAAGRTVPDWAGGTRLGETLRAFLDRWGQRGVARGAVVVIFSDGWERGEAGMLGEQMARLRRLAHAVFWVNPHAGMAGYAPVQSGIAAALPHVDGLLAGHSLATLERLLCEVADA
ncbi:MAG: vWA domain-containing protein [Sciscionella sp.]